MLSGLERDQGKTLIISSHILSDMSEYCTHIGIMSGGSMVQFGTVAQIASHADDSLCRYTVKLAESVPDLSRVLRELEGATNVELNHDSFMLDYSADRKHAAELLSRLLALRLPPGALLHVRHVLLILDAREGGEEFLIFVILCARV